MSVIAELIDLERYPIDQDGAEKQALITDIQAQLDDVGFAVLKGFLTPQAIKQLTQEADNVAHRAHR